MPSRREAWEVGGSREKPPPESVLGSKTRVPAEAGPGQVQELCKGPQSGPGPPDIRLWGAWREGLLREVLQAQSAAQRQPPLCRKRGK